MRKDMGEGVQGWGGGGWVYMQNSPLTCLSQPHCTVKASVQDKTERLSQQGPNSIPDNAGAAPVFEPSIFSHGLQGLNLSVNRG